MKDIHDILSSLAVIEGNLTIDDFRVIFRGRCDEIWNMFAGKNYSILQTYFSLNNRDKNRLTSYIKRKIKRFSKFKEDENIIF